MKDENKSPNDRPKMTTDSVDPFIRITLEFIYG